MEFLQARKKLIEIVKSKIHNGIYRSDIRSFGTKAMLYIVEALIEDSTSQHWGVIEELLFRPAFFDHDCPFSLYGSSRLLVKHKDILPSKIYKKLYDYVKQYKDFSFEKVWDYVGVNDNMPSMHTCAMYFIGKIFDEQRFIDEAFVRMKYFYKMLSRRTFSSEYNSPTYALLAISAYATLHNYSTESEIKELALKIEQKLFKSIFALYYKRGRKVAGPFSRAYTLDETDGITNNDVLLFAVLPESIAPKMDGFFEKDYGSHGEVVNDGPFFQLDFLSLTNEQFHPDPNDIDELIKREYPFEFYGDAEVSSSLDSNLSSIKDIIGQSHHNYESEINASKDLFEYSAGVCNTYTYITNEYSLGTCTKEFHNGVQTDSLHIFTGKDKVSMYTKLTNSDIYPSRECDNFLDCGRKLAFGKENTAVILYKPKNAAVKNFAPRLNFIVFDPGNSVKIDFYTEENGKKVALIETAELFAAVCPTGGKFKTAELKKNGQFKIIIFTYENIADYSLREAPLTAMGAVVEIAKKEMPKENFIKLYQCFDITDTLYANRHTRYTTMRIFGYKNKKYSFDCEYSMLSEGIKYLGVEKIQ